MLDLTVLLNLLKHKQYGKILNQLNEIDQNAKATQQNNWYTAKFFELLNEQDKQRNTFYHHLLNHYKNRREACFSITDESMLLNELKTIKTELAPILKYCFTLKLKFALNNQNETPFHIAAKIGDPQVFEQLLAQALSEKFDVFSKNKQGNTVGHILAKGTLGNDSSKHAYDNLSAVGLATLNQDYLSCFKKLFDQDKEKKLLTLENNYQETILYLAIRDSRDEKLIRHLIQHNANIFEIGGGNNEGCFHIAISAERNANAILEVLVTATELAKIEKKQALFTATDLDGNHFMHTLFAKPIADPTLRIEQHKTLKSFIEQNIVDTNSANQYGETMLHLAIFVQDIEKCNMLLSPKNSTTDVSAQDVGGDTPLHLAAQIYKSLVEQRETIKSQVKTKNEKNKKSSIQASLKELNVRIKNAKAIIKLLLKHKPSLELHNHMGVTLATLACDAFTKKQFRLKTKTYETMDTSAIQQAVELLYYEQILLDYYLEKLSKIQHPPPYLQGMHNVFEQFSKAYEDFFQNKRNPAFTNPEHNKLLKRVICKIEKILTMLKTDPSQVEFLQSLDSPADALEPLFLSLNILHLLQNRLALFSNQELLFAIQDELANLSNTQELTATWGKIVQNHLVALASQYGHYTLAAKTLFNLSMENAFQKAKAYYIKTKNEQNNDGEHLLKFLDSENLFNTIYDKNTLASLYPSANSVQASAKNENAYFEINDALNQLLNTLNFHSQQVNYLCFIGVQPYQGLVTGFLNALETFSTHPLKSEKYNPNEAITECNNTLKTLSEIQRNSLLELENFSTSTTQQQLLNSEREYRENCTNPLELADVESHVKRLLNKFLKMFIKLNDHFTKSQDAAPEQWKIYFDQSTPLRSQFDELYKNIQADPLYDKNALHYRHDWITWLNTLDALVKNVQSLSQYLKSHQADFLPILTANSDVTKLTGNRNASFPSNFSDAKAQDSSFAKNEDNAYSSDSEHKLPN